MTNLLNPKIAVFYTSLLPQLVPSDVPVAPALALLVAVHAALTLAWLTGYAALLHQARGTLHRPGIRAAIDRLTGVVLIAFGVRVATQPS